MIARGGLTIPTCPSLYGHQQLQLWLGLPCPLTTTHVGSTHMDSPAHHPHPTASFLAFHFISALHLQTLVFFILDSLALSQPCPQIVRTTTFILETTLSCPCPNSFMEVPKIQVRLSTRAFLRVISTRPSRKEMGIWIILRWIVSGMHAL